MRTYLTAFYYTKFLNLEMHCGLMNTTNSKLNPSRFFMTHLSQFRNWIKDNKTVLTLDKAIRNHLKRWIYLMNFLLLLYFSNPLNYYFIKVRLIHYLPINILLLNVYQLHRSAQEGRGILRKLTGKVNNGTEQLCRDISEYW